MFIFDVETLSKKSEAVILSLSCIYFEPNEEPSPQELRDSAFFVKFDVEDQVKRLNRKINKSTVDWWKKQCENVRKVSLYPSDRDVKFEEGHMLFSEWVKTKRDNECWVWARGTLDQLVLDDIEEQLDLSPIFQYNRWRDVRTAVDFLYNTKNGYVDVNYEGFDPELHITKHNPIDDCVLDAMMLMYGAIQK